MKLYRIAHPDYDEPFNGEGARLFGGRWNHKGTPLLYYGSTRAIAAFEKRVHLTALTQGAKWREIEIEVPDSLIANQGHGPLPRDWAALPAPDSAKDYGCAWVAAGTSLGLRVPSTVIHREFNVLLNPLHSDIKQAAHITTVDFYFDPRLAK